MGYGTVGQGVYEVLSMNRDSIAARVGEAIEVAHVLDLREFPGNPAESVLTHDVNDIMNDDEVTLVVETMGGVEPAYSFTKQALLAGKSVCTSNKELVAEHGAELRQTANEKGVNYLFEASCGGGIPIIRVLEDSMCANEVLSISGILNGTTNYILTEMSERGSEFAEALQEAQRLGYAELHPEADVEGHDACRKIAILSSLAYGEMIDYRDVHTEGITQIDATDIAYAKARDARIKLLGMSEKTAEGIAASVAPVHVTRDNMLYHVQGVMNAVRVVGNALGESMYYGSGAGSLPTASAVVGDVISMARANGVLPSNWNGPAAKLLPHADVKHRYFMRATVTEAQSRELFGAEAFVHLPDHPEECGFLTRKLSAAELAQIQEENACVVKAIRQA